MRRRLILGAAVAGVVAVLATACTAGGGAGSDKTVTVAYFNYAPFHAADELFKRVAPTFEKQHPGWTVKLVPINAAENDYYTKLDLMNRSQSTAPDVLFEDTFLINSDVTAGYLTPLNSYVEKWPDWNQFYPATKTAAQGKNGKVYGVPMSAGTAGLYYNKQILAKAGLPVPWHPKSWADVLAAARAVKEKVPGVIPLNLYAGTPAGEYSSLWGFQMLMYGTGEQLYSHKTNKWIPPGAGFVDSLTFLKTIYSQGLAPKPEQQLTPNITSIVQSQWLPQGKLAIDLDGAWVPGTNWTAGNPHPWPQWSTKLGWTAFPTQNGQSPGVISMNGGWALSMGAKSPHKAMAWNFIRLALNEKGSLYYVSHSGDLTVRKDVASDPGYLRGRPDLSFWTNLVPHAYYRPAYGPYPQLSNRIQQATEKVVTGQASPQQAAATYGRQLKQIVGAASVQSG